MLGDNIKQIRKAKHISQKDFAKILKIPVSTLANYENNHREPNIVTINKIAAALDVPVIRLLDDVTKEFSFQDNLLNLRIRGLEYYLNEKFLKNSEKTVLINFTNDFLLEYTEMLKKIWFLERNWDDSHNEYNKNSSLSESDLKILYLRENLNTHLKNLSDRINSFPSYIVYNEIKSASDKNDSE